MRRAIASAVICWYCGLFVLQTTGAFAAMDLGEPASRQEPALLTNLFQLRKWAVQELSVVHPFQVVADVIDVDGEHGVLALRDESGVEFIRMELEDRDIAPGATVCLTGTGCALRPRGFGLVFIPRMVVNNDGTHGIRTESGTVLLPAGANPITLQWFNGIGDVRLTVECEGPDLPRQRIPGSLLARLQSDSAGGAPHSAAGLNYRCYEGAWERLPDFSKLLPVKTGVVADFDLEVRTRREAVGLEFNGFIQIPREGAYTFHVSSDDGSRLFVGEASMEMRVLSNAPAPRALEGVPTLTLEKKSRPWVALEGTVNYVGVRGAGAELHMRVGSDDIRVDVLESGDSAPNYPLRTRVRVCGVYEEVVTRDIQRVPGRLLVSSWKSIRPVAPPEVRSTKIVRGADAPRTKEWAPEPASAGTGTPIIGTVEEIKELTPELAGQQLSASIRGVVTAVLE
jgi:hypothetical protein